MEKGSSAKEIFGGEIPKSEVEMWMNRAREQTPESLQSFLSEVRTLIPETYGNCVHIVAISAIAASWAANHATSGITGFQAGCVMWEYIQYWNGLNGPAILQEYENMLYPQYENRFTSISYDTWEWLRSEAKKRLEGNPLMHPGVREHMEKIVSGIVPFGYSVVKE